MGDNAIGVAMQHIQGEVVPPHKINPEVPWNFPFSYAANLNEGGKQMAIQ